GFNLGGTWELGPVVSITKVGEMSWMIGGFVEFNFIKNAPGASFVPGLNVQGTFAKGGTIGVDGTIFGKFFMLGQSSTCIRADGGVQMTKTDAGSEIGFGLGAGLEAYF